MNDQLLQTVHSCFDQLLPYDPLGIKEYLLPWWNQDIFEEYGAKVPVGLFQNTEVLTDPEKAFKFFSERTECRLEEKESFHSIFFDEGCFVVVGGAFSLYFPRLKIFGTIDRCHYAAFKNGERIACELFDCVDLNRPEELRICFDCTDISESDAKDISHVDGNRIEFQGNTGYVRLYRNFIPSDRSAAVEEVKKSILWRVMN